MDLHSRVGIMLRRTLRVSWLRLYALFLATDLVLRVSLPTATHFDVSVFLLSQCASLLFFGFIATLRQAFSVRSRPVFRWIVSFLLAFLWIASVVIFTQFGDYVTASKLKFVVHNISYFAAFLRGYLLNWNLLLLAGVWGILAISWRADENAAPLRDRRLRFGIPVAILLMHLFVLNQLMFVHKGKTISIDASFAMAVKQFRSTTSAGLYHSDRLSLTREPGRPLVNILLIVNESFGKSAFDGTPATAEIMPALHRWIREDSAHTIYFSHAFTSSGATDVSVPSMLTGIAPYESSKRLHEMPFLWDWGKACGARTLFVSAQMFGWGNLKEFFLTPGPDLYLTGEMMGLPYVNDTGVDEFAAMDRFCGELEKLPRDEPFVAVYGSNALHAPFQQSSPALASQPSFPSAYANAASILDAALAKLLRRLDETRLLNSTVVIITSDHGEINNPRRRSVNRIYSFYDEIACIPMIIRVPDAWAGRHPASVAALRLNRDRIVSNIDLLPTVLSLLGSGNSPDNALLASSLSGRSLCAPIAETRYTIALNTNDIRQWEYEGFGIYWRDRRFVFSNLEGPRFFNVNSDPDERVDAWHSATAEDRAQVRAIIDTTFQLKRMFFF